MPEPIGFALDRESVIALRRDHDRLLAMYQDLSTLVRRLMRRPNHHPTFFIAKTTSEITGRSSSTDVPGTGTAKIYRRTWDGQSDYALTKAISDDDSEDTVYNLSLSAIPTDVFVFILRDGYGDLWVSPLSIRLWRGLLNENMGAVTANQAAADLLEMDGTDTTEDITVKDPLAIFSSLVADDVLKIIEQDGEYWSIQSPCP